MTFLVGGFPKQSDIINLSGIILVLPSSQSRIVIIVATQYPNHHIYDHIHIYTPIRVSKRTPHFEFWHFIDSNLRFSTDLTNYKLVQIQAKSKFEYVEQLCFKSLRKEDLDSYRGPLLVNLTVILELSKYPHSLTASDKLKCKMQTRSAPIA